MSPSDSTPTLLLLPLALANLISAFWTFFCITSSTNSASMFHTLLHMEMAWDALWYACQTYAFLVSATNMGLGLVLWRRRVRAACGYALGGGAWRWRWGVWVAGVVGAAFVCFMPFEMAVVGAARAWEWREMGVRGRSMLNS